MFDLCSQIVLVPGRQSNFVRSVVSFVFQYFYGVLASYSSVLRELQLLAVGGEQCWLSEPQCVVGWQLLSVLVLATTVVVYYSS